MWSVASARAPSRPTAATNSSRRQAGGSSERPDGASTPGSPGSLTTTPARPPPESAGGAYPTVDLSAYRDDAALWRSVPMELVRRHRFVPLAEDGERLRIAVAPPFVEAEIDGLELLLDRPLVVHLGDAGQIARVIERNTNSSFLLDRASEDLRIERLGRDDWGAGAPAVSLDALEGGHTGSPVVRLVDSLLVNAVERRATDIHIETKAHEVVLKYRVDGILYPAMEPVDAAHHQTIVARLKVMAELDVAERRVPQDGRFRAALPGRPGSGLHTVDFRVSVMPSVHGEDVVIRVLDKRSLGARFEELSLDALGFSGRELELLREHARRPFGMFLATGPTGSGKTTTLYAALSEIASPEEKIVTVEDPVEYEIAGVTQVPVNEKKGLTFARGLRSILRHDPDTIMVGEVRDPETASIAVQAALTGHLVLTTVHANHALDVIGRFLHMGADPYNFVSALNCIVAQRLVRVLCAACRREAPPDAAEREALGAVAVPPEFVFRPRGCRKCDGAGFSRPHRDRRGPAPQPRHPGVDPRPRGRPPDPRTGGARGHGLAAPERHRGAGAGRDDAVRSRSGDRA